MKVYLVVGKTTGPRGHGEPGQQHLTLLTDEEAYEELGKPVNGFASREKAEKYLKEIDKYRYEVIEIEIAH